MHPSFLKEGEAHQSVWVLIANRKSCQELVMQGYDARTLAAQRQKLEQERKDILLQH